MWRMTLVAVAAAGFVARVSHKTAKAQDNGVLLTGMVKSAQGEKMAGVTVSARADGSTITTSVYTDATGNYYFPPMAAGKYNVWAQTLGFEQTKAQVDLSANKKRNHSNRTKCAARHENEKSFIGGTLSRPHFLSTGHLCFSLA